jgi:N-carbamoyl-L-amino-acid hydrolase
MKRAEFLASLVPLSLAAFQVPALRVNGSRLRKNLEDLSLCGRPPAGTFESGVSRVGFSDADVAGRAFVMRLLREAGVEPRIDAAGNISAIRAGSDPAAAPILFGSHIDSVPNGGNFDGDLGVFAAVEVLHALRGASLKRSLEVVIWAAEEATAYNRSLYGSRAAIGHLAKGELDEVWNGVQKAEAIRKIGGNPDRIDEAKRKPGSFHAYLELHIEQGGTLEQEKLPVGIVEGIVTVDRFEVAVKGFANHAGTTPMRDRQDALLAASQLALAVREIVMAEPGRQVGTVGQFEVSPNSPNVVPGAVRMTIEIRDLSDIKLARIGRKIQLRAQEIAAASRTTIEIRQTTHHDGAVADFNLMKLIDSSAGKLGLATKRLPSGAGHDAQSMAVLGPMGMIFVPSVGGISHSPREFTHWRDCENGANVLLQAVHTLATA